VATREPDIAPPPDNEGVDTPESDFDTVRRGFAPDQVAGYLKRVATSVLSLESRLEETRNELLEAQRERDRALAALETSAGPDPHAAVSEHVTELVRSFDDQVVRLLRDAEAESERVLSDARTEAGRTLAQAREEADRIVAQANEEAERTRVDAQAKEQEALQATRSILEANDSALRHLGVMRETTLELFRDIRDHTVTALDEVEAMIEMGASSDPVVIVEEADEPTPAEVPQVPRSDL
jgi:cell division septum initiation protein DivIVA